MVVTKDDGSPSRLIPLKGNPTLDPGYKEPPGRDSATPLRRLLLDYIEDDYYSLSEVAFIVARAVGQEDPPLDLTISQELVRGLIGDGLARLCLGLTFQGDEQEIVPTDIDSWLKGEHWEKPVPGAGHVRLIITPAGEREHLLN